MEFLYYFPEVFSGLNLAVLLFGVAGGLIMGATPGISPTLAVALLIPFTFSMSATSGLIMLGAVYSAAMTGGAITAILINVPGAPANIATLFDGHKMAVKGQAMSGLHHAMLASGFGGFLGVLVLIFLAPLLSDIAIGFGPSELFWVAVLGITVMGSVGSNSLVLGLLSGALGAWIATIGYSDTFGLERYVFVPQLSSGIDLVGALIGLFAIPEVLNLLATSREESGKQLYKLNPVRIIDSITEFIRHKTTALISTFIGVFVGIIPGAGGQVAGLVAYDQCRRISKYRDNYGKGEVDGVIASEAANNATAGPSLAPLLTLGIPGSPTAAVLMGGLLINGLFPGPELFEQHASVTWTFINALLLSQIVMVVFGLYLARVSRRVAEIPKRYMAVAIFILACYGAYSVRNNFFDIGIMICLGTGMYFLSKVGLSSGPLVLGLILGPIAELNWDQGKMIAVATDGIFEYFVMGNMNMSLIGLCILSILYSIWAAIRAHIKGTTKLTEEGLEEEAGQEKSTQHPGKQSLFKQVLAPIGLGIFSIILINHGFGQDEMYLEPYAFSNTVAVVMLVLSVVWLIGELTRTITVTIMPVPWGAVIGGLVMIWIFVFLIPWVGLLLSAFLMWLMVVISYSPLASLTRTTINALGTGIVFMFVLYLLFNYFLQVQTPLGYLGVI